MDARHPVRVLGCDPGFTSLGWVEAESNLGGLAFTRVGCVHTKKDGDKPAARDLFDRCVELTSGLLMCNVPELLCIEAMSYPRNASSAVKLGASHGVLAAIASAGFDCEVTMLSPFAARKIVTGLKKPTEEDAHEKLRHDFPELDEMVAPLLKRDLPHIMDAAAQVVAWDITTR